MNNNAINKTIHTIQCPACNQTVTAIARNGIIQGLCTIANTIIKIKVS